MRASQLDPARHRFIDKSHEPRMDLGKIGRCSCGWPGRFAPRVLKIVPFRDWQFHRAEFGKAN